MNEQTIDSAKEVICNTYARFPVVLERGDGCRLYDKKGREYIDFMAGIAVCNLGHAHPRLVEAMYEQSRRLWHTSNLYYTEPQVALAEWLTRHCFADKVFFCNSGAEANEAAIKLARKYFTTRSEPGRYKVITMENSFHGRTMATLSATAQQKIRKGFDPILAGFDHAPFDDIEILLRAVDDQTAAIMVEPVQGEGGIRPPSPDYLAKVRQLCDDTGCLLIFDEIQTGMGRTGKLFAHEHFDITPDIMTLAKAMANGLPLGAMLATDEVAAAFGPGSHATTFGGGPVITAVALEVCRIFDDDRVVRQATATGAYFKKALTELAAQCPVITEVRGMGLMLGAALTVPAGPVVTACMEQGFLVNAVQEKVLRFVPPLTIEKKDIDALMAALKNILDQQR